MNKTKKLDELVERVDAVLTQFPDNAPGMVALREELDKAILETWTAVARERAEARAAMDELQSMSDVVRANRWMILGAVAAVAAAAGFIAARARRRIYP
ncbi:MAG TPA: hypothetical protein VGD63_19895 [Steroidobacteraceae bacterium]